MAAAAWFTENGDVSVLAGRYAALAVQALQQIVSGEFDVLMPPLGGPVLTGDEVHPVQAAEVAIHERVPSLGLVGGAIGEPQVPLGVFVPRVRLEERVLLTGTGLDLPQSLSSAYWPLSMSCSHATLSGFTEYEATSPSCPDKARLPTP